MGGACQIKGKVENQAPVLMRDANHVVFSVPVPITQLPWMETLHWPSLGRAFGQAKVGHLD